MKRILNFSVAVTMLTLLSILWPTPAWAGTQVYGNDKDIHMTLDFLNTGTTVNWMPEYEAFYIRIPIYTENGKDNMINAVSLKADDEEIIYLDNWNPDYIPQPDGTTHWVDIKHSKIGVFRWYDNIHPRGSELTSNDRWNCLQGSDKQKTTYVELLWFPPKRMLDGTLLHFFVEGYVCTSNQKYVYMVGSVLRRYSLNTNTPTISDLQWNKDGSLSYTIAKMAHPGYWTQCQPQVSFNNGATWSDVGAPVEIRGNTGDNMTNKNNITFNKRCTIPYEEIHKSLKYNYQDWTKGVTLRVLVKSCGHYWEYAYTPWTDEFYQLCQNTYSNLLFGPKLEPILSATLKQENRDIKLAWKIARDKYSSNDNSDFIIERYDEEAAVWETYRTMKPDSRTDYAITYKISDQECNVGIVKRQFRVRKSTFDAGRWPEYAMASPKALEINTDYSRLNIDNIIQTDSIKKEYEVRWSVNVQSGIWDAKAKLTLNVAEKESGQVIESYTPNYSQKSCRVKGLKPCTEYRVTMEVESPNSGFYRNEYFTSKEEKIGYVTPNLTRTILYAEASKGYFSDKVTVQWELDPKHSDFDYFALVRRHVNTGEETVLRKFPFAPGSYSYSYTDRDMLSGEFYQYEVEGYSKCNDKPFVADLKTDYGFSQPYATVTGNVSFRNKQGELGVEVAAVGADNLNCNSSLKFPGDNLNSSVELPGSALDLSNKAFTMQMWLYVETQKENSYLLNSGDKQATNPIIFSLNSSNELNYTIGTATGNTNVVIPTEKWTQLTITYNYKSVNKLMKVFVNGEKVKEITLSETLPEYNAENKIYIGNTDPTKGLNYEDNSCALQGYIDELRLWNKELREEYIQFNHRAYNSGREPGLSAYYRFDEIGLINVFDISGENSRYNKNHGVLMSTSVKHTTANVPTTEQLANKGLTDKSGNYLINTIPYTDRGNQYEIVPMMGSHEFEPNRRAVFVSAGAQVLNQIDFTDISSFKVSGVVNYENTDYPVEGCNLYIDGLICQVDGKPIMTNNKGEFEIDVPIGEHYITIEKQGHTFKNSGRYPVDRNNRGERHNFDRPIKNLLFEDITKSVVVGRVAGGRVEYDKPLGMAESKANIGQAKIVLEPVNSNYRLNIVRNENGNSVTVDNSTKQLDYEKATPKTKSRAWVGKNTLDSVKLITIMTDPETGEFSAMMPPIKYRVRSVEIPHNEEIIFNTDDIAEVDATDITKTFTDSLTNEMLDKEGLEEHRTEKFVYNAELNVMYKSKAVFDVTPGKGVGYGMEWFAYLEPGATKADSIKVYTYDESGSNVQYTFGYPLFQQLEEYDMNIDAYEKYVNKDKKEKPVEDKVPYKDVIVTVTNEMGAGQYVYSKGDSIGKLMKDSLQENQVRLDANGHGIYRFQTGLPNVNSDHTLGISMTYNIDGQVYTWEEPFKGIVIGEFPLGNNFVTSGPDRIMMVLRDPPGSNSFSYFEKGYRSTKVTESSIGCKLGGNFTSLTKFGANVTNAQGTMGFALVNSLQAVCDMTVGLDFSYGYNNSNTDVVTTTTRERISSSTGAIYVGAMGDVYIGTATNIQFGDAKSVTIGKNKEGIFEIIDKDVLTAKTEYGTSFKYTTYYINKDLLPNLKKNRDALLTTVDEETFKNFVNNSDKPVYITTLKPGDKGYGSNNNDSTVWGEQAVKSIEGPSYRMIRPVGDTETDYEDKVMWHNTQLKLWKETLASNEEAKVTAIENFEKSNANSQGTLGMPYKNHSFDKGVTVESSMTTVATNKVYTTHSGDLGVNVGTKHGVNINETGVIFTWALKIGPHFSSTEGDETDSTQTMGYVLKDEGVNDALSVDVFAGPDGHGAIFRTRAGQTSCPYEKETVTQYYKPGTVISNGTVQLEQPLLRIEKPVVVNVPSGKAATFEVELSNSSGVRRDVWFDITVEDQSNPHGAALYMDGAPITAIGRAVLVPEGKVTKKTIQLRQTDLGILDYENIRVRIQSQCQGAHNIPTAIYSAVDISAHFVPTCSDITLEINDRVKNTTTGTKLPITVKDYDMNFINFRGLKIEYMKEGDLNWTLVKRYAAREQDMLSGDILLDPQEKKVVYNLDMKDYTDGEYKFRAVTMCEFSGETVNNESEIITVVKDMNKPKALGKPTPTNGIYTNESEIAVTFNENIKSDELTKPANFIVRGRLNGYKIDHSTSLRLQGRPEGVNTEANIDLSNTSFAFNMWINLSGAGEIVAHGNATNKMIVKVDPANSLVVEMGGKTYTSENKVPMNKWSFLSVMYDNTQHRLYANVTNDAESVVLMDGVLTDPYTGNGRMAVGRNMSGYIHELTLWNYNRPWSVALSEKSISKSARTQNLTGYWKMDEGHGTTARDYARNRNIATEENSWNITEGNKSAELNGMTYVEINTATCSPTRADDYTLEMWFKAETEQDRDTVSILSNGQGLGLQLSKGRLELVDGTQLTPLSDNTYTDSKWHHIAMSVYRTGSTTIYIDGQKESQFNSANMQSELASDFICLGAKKYQKEGSKEWFYKDHLNGYVDEVRLWKGNVSADFIRNNRYNRMEGTESGLVAYYPFEKTVLDDNQQPVVEGDNADHSTTKAPEIITLFGFADDAPSLKSAPVLQDVTFDYVASDRKIVIEPKESADIIEGTTIEMTLRDVRDRNNNLSDAIIWTAYVQQNELKWEKETQEIVKELYKEKEFTTQISNNSGEYEEWRLSNMPIWLSCDKENGRLAPLGRETLTFSADASMPVGTYEETIYLTGNNNISEPMVVTVTVTGDMPEWSINPESYESSMSVFGKLKINNKYSENPHDQIAAFVGRECVGVASPQYNKRYDAYYVMMEIYSNTEMSGKQVTFKVWEANTGNIYPIVETTPEIKIAGDQLIGTTADPVIWNTTDQLEQKIALNKGWTWLSTYITPTDNSVNSVLKETTGNGIQIKSKEAFANASEAEWTGSLKSIETGKMYKMKNQESSILSIIGEKKNSDQMPITVMPEWNWIGYNVPYVLSLNDAFAGVAPQDGDYVKSQKGFAFYDNYEWIGSLKVMAPGNGYIYKSAAQSPRTFTYPATAPMRVKGLRTIDKPLTFDVVSSNKYRGNMTLTAVVKEGEKTVTDCEVGVFAGSECRGAAYTENNGNLYLTISGDTDGETLTLKVKKGKDIETLENRIIYGEDYIIGTPKDPYIIQLSPTPVGMEIVGNDIEVRVENGVIIVEGTTEEYHIFDAAGTLVYSGNDNKLYLPSGVYMIHIGDKIEKIVL